MIALSLVCVARRLIEVRLSLSWSSFSPRRSQRTFPPESPARGEDMIYANLWEIRLFSSPITFAYIKDWRQAQYRLGKPSKFTDFWIAHGACPKCGGSGRRNH